MSLRDDLQEVMEKLSIDPKALAQRSGVPLYRINDFLRGEDTITVQEYEALVSAAGTTARAVSTGINGIEAYMLWFALTIAYGPSKMVPSFPVSTNRRLMVRDVWESFYLGVSRRFPALPIKIEIQDSWLDERVIIDTRPVEFQIWKSKETRKPRRMVSMIKEQFSEVINITTGIDRRGEFMEIRTDLSPDEIGTITAISSKSLIVVSSSAIKDVMKHLLKAEEVARRCKVRVDFLIHPFNNFQEFVDRIPG